MTKATASIITAADLEAKLTGKVTISDQNKIELQDGGQIWTDNLPADITVSQVKALSEYRNNFTQALSKVVGNVAIPHAKANADVAHLEYSLETPDVDFGFQFARPEVKKGGKVTTELVAAGITSFNRVKSSDAMATVVSELAALWD